MQDAMAKMNFAFCAIHAPAVHSFQIQLTPGSKRIEFVEIEPQSLERFSWALALANRMTRQWGGSKPGRAVTPHSTSCG
jgi:hypothetical protein